MIRLRSNAGFSDNPVCRSIKCTLAVRMLHLFFLFSLSPQLSIVVMTLRCVHPFSTRHCLVDAYEYRREFAQREIHLDVEPRRMNFMSWGKYDGPRCLSRQSDTRSTFFDVTRPAHQTKSSIGSTLSVWFSIWQRETIQRVRLPVLQLKSVDSNDKIDQSVSSNQKNQSGIACTVKASS